MLDALFANMWIAIGAIVVGFVLLIYGADWLVDGASAVAKRLGVSDLVIGLTVVAFGTSMPEFIVSFLAAIKGNTEIAVTNILGSNSINTFVILGLTAMIYPVSSQASSRKFDIPWAVLAGVLVFFFALYTSPDNFSLSSIGSFSENNGYISGIGGVVLLLCFVVFMWHSLRGVSSSPQGSVGVDGESQEICSTSKAVLLILVGLAGLVLGGDMIVRSATSVACQLGVSDAIIGLTIVALGTSLPELATSCMAAYKKNSDLALGNVVGSNIFNVFFILGVSAVVHPLPTYDGVGLDAAMVVLSASLVWLFVHANKEHEIKRWHGVILLLSYGVYLGYRLMTL